MSRSKTLHQGLEKYWFGPRQEGVTIDDVDEEHGLGPEPEMTDIEKDRIVAARKFALLTALNASDRDWHSNPYSTADEIVEYILRGIHPDTSS